LLFLYTFTMTFRREAERCFRSAPCHDRWLSLGQMVDRSTLPKFELGKRLLPTTRHGRQQHERRNVREGIWPTANQSHSQCILLECHYAATNVWPVNP
jgi:hypothetical protein